MFTLKDKKFKKEKESQENKSKKIPLSGNDKKKICADRHKNNTVVVRRCMELFKFYCSAFFKYVSNFCSMFSFSWAVAIDIRKLFSYTLY